MCALNSTLSVYCFPQIVHVDGLSGDISDDEECRDEEDESANEDAESASEHEDAAGDAAMAGDEGDDDDDSTLDCKVDARFIPTADFTGVSIVRSNPSLGTVASIGFPSRMLLAMDLAEDALTTRWTNRSCWPPTVAVVVPPMIAPAIGEASFGDPDLTYRIRCGFGIFCVGRRDVLEHEDEGIGTCGESAVVDLDKFSITFKGLPSVFGMFAAARAIVFYKYLYLFHVTTQHYHLTHVLKTFLALIFLSYQCFTLHEIYMIGIIT